ncbi:MAG: hypothetical protein CMF48_02190 [Legionellales bacterium]|nr:hypothetical protein [Legionellales bacterium]|tara:strand:+ start:598 stop:2457 length:1860 start_codon:yes stop_codon:yes gene_type:complete
MTPEVKRRKITEFNKEVFDLLKKQSAAGMSSGPTMSPLAGALTLDTLYLTHLAEGTPRALYFAQYDERCPRELASRRSSDYGKVFFEESDVKGEMTTFLVLKRVTGGKISKHKIPVSRLHSEFKTGAADHTNSKHIQKILENLFLSDAIHRLARRRVNDASDGATSELSSALTTLVSEGESLSTFLKSGFSDPSQGEEVVREATAHAHDSLDDISVTFHQDGKAIFTAIDTPQAVDPDKFEAPLYATVPRKATATASPSSSAALETRTTKRTLTDEPPTEDEYKRVLKILFPDDRKGLTSVGGALPLIGSKTDYTDGMLKAAEEIGNIFDSIHKKIKSKNKNPNRSMKLDEFKAATKKHWKKTIAPILNQEQIKAFQKLGIGPEKKSSNKKDKSKSSEKVSILRKLYTRFFERTPKDKKKNKKEHVKEKSNYAVLSLEDSTKRDEKRKKEGLPRIIGERGGNYAQIDFNATAHAAHTAPTTEPVKPTVYASLDFDGSAADNRRREEQDLPPRIVHGRKESIYADIDHVATERLAKGEPLPKPTTKEHTYVNSDFIDKLREAGKYENHEVVIAHSIQHMLPAHEAQKLKEKLSGSDKGTVQENENKRRGPSLGGGSSSDA